MDESIISIVRRGRGAQHLHHKANARGSGRVSVELDYLKQVAHALHGAGAVLITGPASAKSELVDHIHREHPKLAKHLSGVAVLDHPSDGELVAYGRRYFRADERMHPQRVLPVA
jgi:stalled ribosome rescue protein Dom34